ncbi:MAG TPA: xanthine dehydrogenase family protein subunit M [Syntrophomonadaceae bacterium]|nr:xanthine dehydrogenase family protein subunit M [Syntrophomonadaceae bacterium]HPR93654.1 xanthine dehydrogenase family protein subunit M [Syntrophomonadaceae bacterium]
MRVLDYFEPTSVKETSSLLAKFEGAKIVAGGTDLVVDMNKKNENPRYIIDIKNIPNLDYIEYQPGQGLKIGALTTIAALQKSDVIIQKYSIIQQATLEFANIAIRNVATLGGNLCAAVPSSDMAPGLIALGAKVKIAGVEGEKVIPLEEFFVKSKKSALQKDELLVEIQVPEQTENTRGIYYKFSKRGEGDLAIVGVAVVITLDSQKEICQDIKIALGNVAPTPMRAHNAESILRGNKIDEALIDKCVQAAADETNARKSYRASVEYKKDMVKVFAKKAISKAIA